MTDRSDTNPAQSVSDRSTGQWLPMNTAPTAGAQILVSLNGWVWTAERYEGGKIELVEGDEIEVAPGWILNTVDYDPGTLIDGWLPCPKPIPAPEHEAST